MLDDPTAVGATLEVEGATAGDGDTGVLALDAARWTGLGNPPGARGYRYLDRDRTTGVKKVILKSGNAGGTLAISGGGALSSLETTVLMTVDDTMSALRMVEQVRYRAPGT